MSYLPQFAVRLDTRKRHGQTATVMRTGISRVLPPLHFALFDEFAVHHVVELSLQQDEPQGRVLGKCGHRGGKDNLHCSQILIIHQSKISILPASDVVAGGFHACVKNLD